ncbi:dopamine D2-like receptor [Stylophora pistillata]|uniref:dopamine D2-like receptor n=1 Tax=Stylophora pistillata TaxID=50429 RepID=UPI000C0393C5|nr:dopamine D2-like receptor [Stylophora pistillata]
MVNNTSYLAFNTSLKISPSKAEGIALCSSFILTSVFSVAGNSLALFLFAVNKKLRKKSLFLIINMAFADLMVGTLCLPIYVYFVGDYFQLWTNQLKDFLSSGYYTFIDSIFTQASIISAAFISCERFYAVYWPLKHRTLMRAHRVAVILVWILAFLISGLFSGLWLSVSTPKYSIFVWAPYILILTLVICSSNLCIWKKLRRGSLASQRNRSAPNKRLTKTLLFVSIISLLSWLPLVITNVWIMLTSFSSISHEIYFMVNVINYSNAFVNPVVYVLRIPEFRQALGLCPLRRGTTRMERKGRGNNMTGILTPSSEVKTFGKDSRIQQGVQFVTNEDIAEDVLDTEL